MELPEESTIENESTETAAKDIHKVQKLLPYLTNLDVLAKELSAYEPEQILMAIEHFSKRVKKDVEKDLLLRTYRQVAQRDVEKAFQLLRLAAEREA